MKNSILKKVRGSLRNSLLLPKLYFEWNKQSQDITNNIHSLDLNSVLIATPDPRFLVSSKGDEAMITGIIERVIEHRPNCNISMLSDLTELPDSLAKLGVSLISKWSNPWSLASLKKIINHHDSLLIVGADVMDGHYSPVSAARLWVLGDIAARLGKRSVVLGFSFNDYPSGWLKPFLRRLSPDLHIYSRDAVSQQRFNTFCQEERSELVADSAFLLRPKTDSEVVKRVETWCKAQREQNHMVCGFNIHPMLIKNASQEQIDQLVKHSVEALSQVLISRPVSFVFISHDYRGPGTGDCEVLASVAEKLVQQGFKGLLTFNEHLHAAELKALVGLMDIVITGRMHLSIAALGQGTPVAAITYQGKFHGLFQHFGLDEQFLISPDEIKDDKVFAEWIIKAIDQQQQLAAQVKSQLPVVKKLAEKNLSAFLDDSEISI